MVLCACRRIEQMKSKILLSFSLVFVFSFACNPSQASNSAEADYYRKQVERITSKDDVEAARSLMLKMRMKTRRMTTGAPEAADAFATLADYFAEKRRNDEMNLCMKEALRIREQSDGPNSAAVISLQSRFAQKLIAQGKNKTAFQILQNCIQLGKSGSGEANVALEPVYVQMAKFYSSSADYRTAKDYLLQAVALAKKAPGFEQNINLPSYYFDLSICCNGLSQFKESEQFARESARLAEKVYSRTDERRAADLANLAVILKEQKKQDEANRIITRLWNDLGQPANDAALKSCYTVGQRFLVDRYYEEALPFLKAASENYSKLKGPDDQYTIQSTCNLVQALGARKDLPGAEKVLARINVSGEDAHRMSGNPLFDCNRQFERARKYFSSKQQHAMAMKVGLKQLEFLTSDMACQSCAHLCLPDCYKELVQTATRMGDKKGAQKYSECLAAIRGPAPAMR